MEIRMDKIDKRYGGRKVLSDFTLRVETGECICLMGESGSGKTTVFRLLLGLEKADGGEIYKGGNKMSAVFQDNRLFEELSAYKNIKIACDYNISKEKIINHLGKLLPREAAMKPVKYLSGGMKRRVAVVRAMLSRSGCIVMDEPFTGLDSENKKNVISYIKTYKEGRSLLYSTHDEKEFQALGGRLVYLKREEKGEEDERREDE